MKRLAVFMDGTWNVPESDTNVSRLLRFVAPVDQNAVSALFERYRRPDLKPSRAHMPDAGWWVWVA
jgi:hypothetical protein